MIPESGNGITGLRFMEQGKSREPCEKLSEQKKKQQQNKTKKQKSKQTKLTSLLIMQR